METKLEKHRRYANSIRQWMQGRGYFNALRAMEFASTFHVGVRKDGQTPEFFHQISIALYVRSVADLLFESEVALAAVFLHDVCEDYNVSYEEVEAKFGHRVREVVELLSKEYRGVKKTTEEYYRNLVTCQTASVVKGADRMNNVQTMIGPFTPKKVDEYIDETIDFVLPMLKTARRKFPEQDAVYQNIKHILVSQLDLIDAMSQIKES